MEHASVRMYCNSPGTRIVNGCLHTLHSSMLVSELPWACRSHLQRWRRYGEIFDGGVDAGKRKSRWASGRRARKEHSLHQTFLMDETDASGTGARGEHGTLVRVVAYAADRLAVAQCGLVIYFRHFCFIMRDRILYMGLRNVLAARDTLSVTNDLRLPDKHDRRPSV